MREIRLGIERAARRCARGHQQHIIPINDHVPRPINDVEQTSLSPEQMTVSPAADRPRSVLVPVGLLDERRTRTADLVSHLRSADTS